MGLGWSKPNTSFVYFLFLRSIVSSGTKKDQLFLAHANTQLKHKNITIDVKLDTNSNLFTTVTIDEPAPGLKTILSFRVPYQRSGKVKDVRWDAELGGQNMELQLVEYFADEFNKQLGNGVDIRNNVNAMTKLKKQVKRTKEILSANTMAPISIESLYDDCDFRFGKSVLFPGKGSNCYDLCLKSNSEHKQRGIQCGTPEKYSKIGFYWRWSWRQDLMTLHLWDWVWIQFRIWEKLVRAVNLYE